MVAEADMVAEATDPVPAIAAATTTTATQQAKLQLRCLGYTTQARHLPLHMKQSRRLLF